MKKPDERFEQMVHQAMNLRADIAALTAELMKTEEGLDTYYEMGETGALSCEYAAVMRLITPRFFLQPEAVQMLSSTAAVDIHKLREGVQLQHIRVFSYHQLQPFPRMPREIAHV